MKRNFHIRIGKKELDKILEDKKKGLPFIEIDGSNIHEFGFEITQIDEYERPKNFPVCCNYHKHFYEWANDWFKEFPNCCKIHKKLKKKDWFDKSKYNDVPNKILQAISYTEFQIAHFIDHENWYKLITDYIDYCFHSFGSPSVGMHIYQDSIEHYIKNSKPKSFKFPNSKRNRLLEFFQVTESKNKPTDLNILYNIFQKWINNFPDLIYFNNLKSRFKDKIPISIIIYEPEYNSYLGLSKMKSRTKGELLKILIDTTNKILRNIDSKKLIDDEVISNLNSHELDLISAKHKIKQNSLLVRYSKKEAKYVKLIKEWLKNERQHFKEINDFMASNEAIYLEKLNQIHTDTKSIKESINLIETDFNDLVFLLDSFTADQKIAIDEILTSLDKFDKEQIERDLENDEMKSKLIKIIESLENSKLTLDEKTKLKSKVKEATSISVKHKMKFIIPLLIMKYEAEIELGNKQTLPKTWKEWKSLVFAKE